MIYGDQNALPGTVVSWPVNGGFFWPFTIQGLGEAPFLYELPRITTVPRKLKSDWVFITWGIFTTYAYLEIKTSTKQFIQQTWYNKFILVKIQIVLISTNKFSLNCRGTVRHNVRVYFDFFKYMLILAMIYRKLIDL